MATQGCSDVGPQLMLARLVRAWQRLLAAGGQVLVALRGLVHPRIKQRGPGGPLDRQAGKQQALNNYKIH